MNDPDADFQRGFSLHQRGDLAAAEEIYRSILQFWPEYFNAAFALGLLFLQQAKFQPAEQQFSRAIEINPDNSRLHTNHGNALLGLNRAQEALSAYDRAVALDSENYGAFYNRGNILAALKRFEEALASYDKAIALFPDDPEAHDNRGNTLAYLNRFDEALASFDRAIRLNPNEAKTYANRAGIRKQLRQFDKAAEDYDKAFALNPRIEYLFGNRLSARIHICAWDSYDDDCRFLLGGLRNGTLKMEPFALLAIPSTPEDQLNNARQFVRDKAPLTGKSYPHGSRNAHDRIRLGYVSSDFHNHAIGHLVTGMLEAHDRSKFEVHGFSLALDKNDAYRERIVRTCDEFVHGLTIGIDKLIQRIRDSEIDILIDLNGYTAGSRTEIFAARPAPVQVNFLGYPGTMAAEYIDYLIGDRIVIPEEAARFYDEKIVYLPDSYQANDSKRPVAKCIDPRRSHGLPETGFVFCCFNNSYKITPEMFDIWMHLLKKVDGSVLWLLENASATENLKKEAERRGVPAERLVFADKKPLAEHLSRHQLADLFLDTLHYNAHTTGSDALWAGLPVVTYTGTTFASRVATSLLHAVGLPELATDSLENYERLALELAANPDKLRAMKNKLVQNRATYPLFDTARFTRHIEAAYRKMHEISQAGKSPRSFAVEPIS
jgi:predicted O-linked N-acetylglucosamine transferase (SPINDLY family)